MRFENRFMGRRAAALLAVVGRHPHSTRKELCGYAWAEYPELWKASGAGRFDESPKRMLQALTSRGDIVPAGRRRGEALYVLSEVTEMHAVQEQETAQVRRVIRSDDRRVRHS